jgi:CRP/FNR family transcriptional regulator, cyclic AMP receptor protein
MKAPALKNVPLFSDLNDGDLESLASVASVRLVEQETVILQAEEEGDTLFVILEGRVSVSMGNEEGKEVILSILTAGDFFGEMSLLDGKPRSASVIATEQTELLLLRRADFLYCMERNANMASRLVGTLANRLRRTNRQVESLALLNAYGRVVGVLLQLAEDQQDEKNIEKITIFERPILQEIANMAGTTRETVSRILNNLEKRGYIKREGRKLTLLDLDRLEDDFFFHP